MFVFFDDVEGAVGGAAVDNDVFDIVVGLVDDAEYGFFEEFFAVIDHGDDSDEGFVCL